MNLEEERRESAQCEDDKAESWFFTKIFFTQFWFMVGWVWFIWTSFFDRTRHQFVGLL